MTFLKTTLGLGRAAIVVGWAFLAVAGVAVAGGLQEEILDHKYRWGDYAVYGGWYDPGAEQFDVHGSAAFPIGAKVRLRWGRWILIEADASYYRRSSEARPSVSIFAVPEFDGLMVAATVQSTVGRWGRLRPYAGGGPVFVSLTNDFIAIIREVEDADPNLLVKFQLASWNELDLGFQVVAGFDFHLARRVFPFLEYRQLFGGFPTDDIRIGAFRYTPDELKTEDDRDLPGSYDWSGPIVMVGLKIRF